MATGANIEAAIQSMLASDGMDIPALLLISHQQCMSCRLWLRSMPTLDQWQIWVNRITAIVLLQPEIPEAHLLSQASGLIDLVLVVLEHYHLPYGLATCCYESIGILHDPFPTNVAPVDVIGIFQTIYAEEHYESVTAHHSC